jgi:Lon protease-like protein
VTVLTFVLAAALTMLLPQAAAAPALPAEIPLFPLPETTIFPGVSRPLLIYEPRYREMIADALKGNRIIGMVRLRPGFEKDYEGRPPIYAIGCAGRIEKYEELPDGRYVILLHGLTPFRVNSESQGRPYRLGRVETVPDRLPDGDRLALSSLRNRLAAALVTVLPFGVEPPDPSLDDEEFVNLLAQNLPMSEDARQDLLERSSLVARAQALLDSLSK